ncbi:MAG: hypothetical protein ABI415_03735 [Flavitalea sp.]
MLPIRNADSAYDILNKRSLWYLGVILAIILFFVIANPIGMYFLNDDFIHIPLATSGNFLHSNLLRPIADVTLWIDGQVWGKNAFGFHVTNICVHLINSLLVFLLYKKLFSGNKGKYTKEKALLAAILFLLYAFHSESIFWIIARGGSLAALSILISLNCFISSKGIISLIVALIAFAIGLFTYEFVWIVPLLIIVLQLNGHNKGNKQKWMWSVWFIVVFVIYLIARQNIHRVYLSNYELGTVFNFRIRKLFYNYTLTLARCFIPPVENKKILLLVLSLLLGIGASAIIRIKKTGTGRALIIPVIFLLISCLPSISVGIDTHDTEGERFLYVPSVFFCWFIVELVFTLFHSLNVSLMVIVGLLIFHAFFLFRSAESYRYSGKLVSSSIACLKATGPAEMLSAEGVPTQYMGALIFRMGFAEAMHWMLPYKFKRINILTTQEIFTPVYFHCDNASPVIKKEVKRISWNKKGLIIID